MSGAQGEAEIEVSFPCPCGGRCEAGHTVPQGEPVAFHTVPACEEYTRLDLPDYLAFARRGMRGAG